MVHIPSSKLVHNSYVNCCYISPSWYSPCPTGNVAIVGGPSSFVPTTGDTPSFPLAQQCQSVSTVNGYNESLVWRRPSYIFPRFLMILQHRNYVWGKVSRTLGDWPQGLPTALLLLDRWCCTNKFSRYLILDSQYLAECETARQNNLEFLEVESFWGINGPSCWQGHQTRL